MIVVNGFSKLEKLALYCCSYTSNEYTPATPTVTPQDKTMHRVDTNNLVGYIARFFLFFVFSFEQSRLSILLEYRTFA